MKFASLLNVGDTAENAGPESHNVRGMQPAHRRAPHCHIA
jgi:hypothetical protein